MTDLVLAIIHHLLVFTLAGVLAGEFVLMRKGLAGRELKILAHIDRMYGVLALAVIAIGIGRVIYGLKGWEYYIGNHAFWGKMLAFVIVALLSIKPTMRILAWSRAGKDGAYVVPDAEIAATRRFLAFQIVAFAFILVFAATMARWSG